MREFTFVTLLVPSLFIALSTLLSTTSAAVITQDATPIAFTNTLIVVSPEANLPPAILSRLLTYLPNVVEVTSIHNSSITTNSTTLIFSIGQNNLTRLLIPTPPMNPESFTIRSNIDQTTGATLIAIDGASPAIDTPNPKTGRTAKPFQHGNRGLAYGVYAALEELGFFFGHPLKPSVPESILIEKSRNVSVDESPRWEKFRTIHYHTQHPLELTPFLQGFGLQGVDDVDGWTSIIPEWHAYCEWLVSNRQTGMEYPLLESARYADFAGSQVRIARLKTIVDIAHSYGLNIGVDVPIAFAQQHSFRLLKDGTGKPDHLDAEKAEIRDSMDWVMQAGYDFLGSENGSSEFTSTPPSAMLEWINTVAEYAASKYNIPVYMKVHCSTGQVAKGFVDPRTGNDINFNMLPYYAHPNMGVLPHTVEAYSLDDPAPTYGNTNFTYMKEYLQWELKNGNRSVAFFPETAYWVSVDIDVPLFMPLYGERRLYDLRLLANDEDKSRGQNKMDGQMIFSSGWEWSYWLNDHLAARASWNPHTESPTQSEAFTKSLYPFLRHLATPSLITEATVLLQNWTTIQHRLLINGQLPNDITLPLDIYKRNGIAYLSGWDTWDDVSKLISKLTQPDHIGIVDLKDRVHGLGSVVGIFGDRQVQFYKDYVGPLLMEMDLEFDGLANRTEVFAGKVEGSLKDLWDDIADSARMTALRAHQVRLLYDYVFSLGSKEDVSKGKEAVATVRAALKVVQRRELKYRVPADRIAGWTNLNGPNPTAYAFNYLWTVRSLHYWWRDIAKALAKTFSSTSPSFLNIINPVEVGLGEGVLLCTAQTVANVLSFLGIGKDFLDVAEKEPHYPDDIPNWKNSGVWE
ncbi:hypothetical protein HDU76_013901 [Blyttiomyces sp. JEL0837]|nr:hypothetical protein HDU76_013901 [Blyttiomyces sp. JEL0837]